MEQRWPDILWVVRHGESAGNVARDLAYAKNLPTIDIIERDVDVPLSTTGETQSRALGRWLAKCSADERPTVALTSPYMRARRTTALIADEGGTTPEARIIVDERLREKEFGVLDRLTRLGIEQQYPEQAAIRTHLGKFYHRPPGGESWCDVILRLRTVLDTISLHHSTPGTRVLVVAHQVIVLCFRYLLENLDERQVLAIDAEGDVANCGVTVYDLNRREDALRLREYNFVAPLQEEGAPVTTEPDAPVAVK